MSAAIKGSKLNISARDWNQVREAASNVRVDAVSQRVPDLPKPEAAGSVVLVRNTHPTTTIPRFGVIGLGDPAIVPADTTEIDRLYVRRGRVLLDGTVPAAGTHETKLAIAQAPIAAGAIGEAIRGGVTPAILDVTNASHEYAAIDGGVAKLQSAETGPIRILWKGTGTGEVSAVVEFKQPPLDESLNGFKGVFSVDLIQTGGSAGTAATNCTFTYTVDDFEGNELGTNKAPLWRPVPGGPKTAATKGIAHYEGSTLMLDAAYEGEPGSIECEVA